MPKVSVIITCFNQADTVTETIQSVLNQTLKDIEIIIVDDGSTDASVKIITKYTKKFKNIQLITQKNSGVLVARTNGIHTAHAEYIFMLDGDDKIAPTALEKMYYAITHKYGDIITSRVMLFGLENAEMVLRRPNKLNMADANCLVNAALIKKSDFLLCGGFDPRFSTMLEDYDLWLNLLYNHNKRIYRIPEILFYYRIKPFYQSRNFKSREKLLKSLRQLLRTKYPIHRWHTINNIIRYPKRIAGWFVKEKNRCIYVLGIPMFMHREKHKLAYWFRLRPNFGDMLTPALFDYLGHPVLHTEVSTCDVVAIGSLMEIFFSNNHHRIVKSPVIVWGTGFIKAPSQHKKYLKRRLDVRAVRGYYTLHRLQQFQDVKISPNVAVGDPGLLAGLLLNGKMPKKKYKLGIIPHYVDKDNPLLNKIKVKNSVVLDIATEPTEFMKQIAECENIISSAMHGLIAADSLGIPNIRMVLSNKIIGGNYKYNDYYSAFGIKKHNVINLSKQSFTDADLKKLRDMYQITPEQVRNKQQELLDAFPYDIKEKTCL